MPSIKKVECKGMLIYLINKQIFMFCTCPNAVRYLVR